MIDNSSIVVKCSTALPARNLQLIFLVLVTSSIPTVFGIVNIIGDLHITFLNCKIVKVKVLLKYFHYCNLIWLISSANRTFFLLLLQLFHFLEKDVRKKRLFPKQLHCRIRDLIGRIGERGRLKNNFRFEAWSGAKQVLDQAEILWNEFQGSKRLKQVERHGNRVNK